MSKRRYVRAGQTLFRGWYQIGEVCGLKAGTIRRVWREMGLPIFFVRRRPMTSRGLLEEYAKQRLKLAEERGCDGTDIKRAVRKSSSRRAISGDPH